MVRAGDPLLMKPALDTAFADAADGVLKRPPTCDLEHQSSFARSSDGWKKGAAYTHSADVIPGARADNRWEVSGDLAARAAQHPAGRRADRLPRL